MIGPAIRIITCGEWGARKPRSPIVVTHAAARVIFHHTAGHHHELDGTRDDTVAEAKRYARDVQAFHMDVRGWIDSGHNFLVTRSGRILQGRWLTVSAIEAGQMVVSAHCPGFNGQIGIEHEHVGNEAITPIQFESSARLQAWIAWHYDRAAILPADPHRAHFATSCPANLAASIEPIRKRARAILAEHLRRSS